MFKVKIVLLTVLFLASLESRSDIVEGVKSGVGAVAKTVKSGVDKINPVKKLMRKDPREAIRVNDFHVESDIKGIKYSIKLVKKSIKWERILNSLATPKALISIKFKTDRALHLRYKKQSITLQKRVKNNIYYTEFYIDLFSSEYITVYDGETYMGEIDILPNLKEDRLYGHMIDHSCNRYKLKVVDFDDQFISIGCTQSIIGKFGKERPMVEVYWTSAEWKLMDGSDGPYKATLLTSDPLNITVKDHKGHIRNFKIEAKIPKKESRFKSAYGFGPYQLTVRNDQGQVDDSVAPAIMFYGKYRLDSKDINSIKVFDALVSKSSFFNNAGLYFSTDVAKVFDDRIVINTMLGFQHLTLSNSLENSETFSSFIGPQGVEIIWHHPFNWDNYVAVYGIFYSTSADSTYINTWLRWGGGGMFWELNYIGYENTADDDLPDVFSKTWGLSVGFPFFQLF